MLVAFDLAPVHELCYGLPAGADEATLLAETGVLLVPIRKATRRPDGRADKLALRAHRQRIEALFSQLGTMGVQRLRAHPNPGLELKRHAALLTATITNAD